MTTDRPRVAAYGFFGMGNIGNEGSLDSLLTYLRAHHPNARVACFGAGTDAVQCDHGIPATQLMSLRADPRRRGLLVKAAKALSRLWDIPRTFRMMGKVDVLVVPGTGVFESSLITSAWGLPYWLLLATVSCRLRRRQVALVSVGAEYATHPLTRWFHRWTLRLATYRSYRDEESRSAARLMGAMVSDQVYPDLAFALPTPDGVVERPGHVVIGVMAYDGTPDSPGGPLTVRQTYAERISALVLRLLDQGRSVTLVIGDVHDRRVAETIRHLVMVYRPGVGAEQVSISHAYTMEAIMTEMAAAEVVVASRFHNVISALMLSKPTISLGYAGKQAHLLDKFGLGAFDHPIDDFEVDAVVAQIAELQHGKASLEVAMKDTLRRFDEELNEQFDQLSAQFLDPHVGARHRRQG
jgi:polysaccharide pyruvyl transferase WcaK-like protein